MMRHSWNGWYRYITWPIQYSYWQFSSNRTTFPEALTKPESLKRLTISPTILPFTRCFDSHRSILQSSVHKVTYFNVVIETLVFFPSWSTLSTSTSLFIRHYTQLFYIQNTTLNQIKYETKSRTRRAGLAITLPFSTWAFMIVFIIATFFMTAAFVMFLLLDTSRTKDRNVLFPSWRQGQTTGKLSLRQQQQQQQ